ncbi:hypothetical protein DL93DRAFT_552307 [Clavulina sp. PMI_390]|nr:hypothetical protein DL93DRAFT_552307 [Clavulina sp. PMI_390]
MLEKALAAHPANRTSPVLRLRYLEAVREAKGAKEEEAAWERALLEIKSEELWLQYITYRLTRGGVSALDAAVVRIMKEIASSQFEPRRAFFARLRVFWRTIVALKQAGYLERATSAVQAQIEL